jgi:hypothetical protein
VCLPDPKRNSFFSSHPSVFYFFTIAQPKTDKNSGSLLLYKKVVQIDTNDRTPSANSGFAKAGVQCFG